MIIIYEKGTCKICVPEGTQIGRVGISPSAGEKYVDWVNTSLPQPWGSPAIRLPDGRYFKVGSSSSGPNTIEIIEALPPETLFVGVSEPQWVAAEAHDPGHKTRRWWESAG